MKSILILALVALAFVGCTAQVVPSSWSPPAARQNPTGNELGDGGTEAAAQPVTDPPKVDAGGAQVDGGTPTMVATDDAGVDSGSPVMPTSGQDAQPPGQDAGQSGIDSGNPPTQDAGVGPVVVSCVVPNVGTYSSSFADSSVNGQPVPSADGYYIEFTSAAGKDSWVSCGGGTCTTPPAPCPSGSQCFVYPPSLTLSGTCQ